MTIAISPKKNLVAADGLFYDLATKKVRQWSAGHKDFVTSLAFSSDGRALASAANDKEIKLWDASTGKLLETLKGHRGSVYCVSFSPDGKSLASGGGDNDMRLWDVSKITGRK